MQCHEMTLTLAHRHWRGCGGFRVSSIFRLFLTWRAWRASRVSIRSVKSSNLYLISTTLWIILLWKSWLKYISLGKFIWFGKYKNIFSVFCGIISEITGNFTIIWGQTLNGWIRRAYTWHACMRDSPAWFKERFNEQVTTFDLCRCKIRTIKQVQL